MGKGAMLSFVRKAAPNHPKTIGQNTGKIRNVQKSAPVDARVLDGASKRM
jgi:hypothetical protein